MKQIITTIITAACLVYTAQAQDLPKPSPAAEIEQRVGLTDIEVSYSRPGVKGRTIWGDLVPFNELWRAGANKATQFSTSTDITIQGKTLPAGDYSFFILPSDKGDWMAVFNKETELWGTGDYKKEDDQLRVKMVKSAAPEMVERLEYHFINLGDESVDFVMDWEKIRLSLTIEVDPAKQALANIEKALAESEDGDKWKVYRSAAAYARDQNNMTEQGLKWIEQSVKLKNDNWYSYWVYADLYAQSKKFDKAMEMGNKAIEVGKAGSPEFSYTDRIQADIDEWKSKK